MSARPAALAPQSIGRTVPRASALRLFWNTRTAGTILTASVDCSSTWSATDVPSVRAAFGLKRAGAARGCGVEGGGRVGGEGLGGGGEGGGSGAGGQPLRGDGAPPAADVAD